MRLLALTGSSDDPMAVAGGFLLRVRERLAAMTPVFTGRWQSTYGRDPALLQMQPANIDRGFASNAPSSGGTVVSFPLNGYTRLLQLAQCLKQPFVDLGLEDHHPLVLHVSGGSRPCLLIDPTAYVEFRGPQLGYRGVFDDAFETRITVETKDFEAVERLVRIYISTKLADVRVAEGVA